MPGWGEWLMVSRRWICVASVAWVLAGIAVGQSKNGAPEQSPRKAILEMFSGGDEAFKKHLTLEVQAKFNEILKKSSPDGADPLQTVAMAKAAGGNNLETFESGPILFSYNNREQHERTEVRIDSEDLRGDQDDMQLSIHSLRGGVEQDLPVELRLWLMWKLQQNIWRLNAVTVSATFAVGDPRVFDKSTWMPPMGPLAFKDPAGAKPSTALTPVAANEPPKMTAARAVRLITLAENLYEKKHPDTGFTCVISDLVGVGKGLEDGKIYTFMDPEFSGGVYNGYRFSLIGCDAKPAKAFQVAAEPVSGTGRAYCSDATRDLRASDDGSGSHCLASGKIVQH
jgi:hypothetical protein